MLQPEHMNQKMHIGIFLKYTNQFLKYIYDSDYSSETKRIYRYFIKRLNSIFNTLNLPDDERQVTESDMIVFSKYIRELKISDPMKFNLILYSKIYFRYLEKHKIIFKSPASELKTPKENKKHRKILSQKRMMDVLNTLETETPYDIRSKAMFEILYSTAIRPGELARLKICDIDFEQGMIFINQGKGKKDRYVPIGKTALLWVQKYIKDIRPKNKASKKSNYMFVPINGCRHKLSDRSIAEIFRKTLKQYNIDHFCPYVLRATAATHLLENGVNVNYISELLGHEDIRTTQIYLRVSKHSLKKVLDRQHPRLKEKNL